jgi:hypothetical protein
MDKIIREVSQYIQYSKSHSTWTRSSKRLVSTYSTVKAIQHGPDHPRGQSVQNLMDIQHGRDHQRDQSVQN